MTTATSYGSWQVDNCLTVEDWVAVAVGEFADDYDIDAIVSDLRGAINGALPDGVSLNGNEFYGPYYNQPDYDLDEILESIDFWAIVERHDKTQGRG